MRVGEQPASALATCFDTPNRLGPHNPACDPQAHPVPLKHPLQADTHPQLPHTHRAAVVTGRVDVVTGVTDVTGG